MQQGAGARGRPEAKREREKESPATSSRRRRRRRPRCSRRHHPARARAPAASLLARMPCVFAATPPPPVCIQPSRVHPWDGWTPPAPQKACHPRGQQDPHHRRKSRRERGFGLHTRGGGPGPQTLGAASDLSAASLLPPHKLPHPPPFPSRCPLCVEPSIAAASVWRLAMCFPSLPPHGRRRRRQHDAAARLSFGFSFLFALATWQTSLRSGGRQLAGCVVLTSWHRPPAWRHPHPRPRRSPRGRRRSAPKPCY